MPLHTRPQTPIPEDKDVCPLNTFEMGTRSGESSWRIGGSNLSARYVLLADEFYSRD